MTGQLQRVTISRSTKKDLESGILELEKRGYTLVGKGYEENEKKQFNYKETRFGPKERFSGWYGYKKYRAIMERIYHKK